MVKKESSIYENARKIGDYLSSRQTLSAQLMREYDLSQIGNTSKSGIVDFIQYQEKKTNIMKELENKIAEQARKVEKLNNFSEHMHFLDDHEIVEIYEVIHNEEKVLKELNEKLALLKQKLEDKEASIER